MEGASAELGVPEKTRGPGVHKTLPHTARLQMVLRVTPLRVTVLAFHSRLVATDVLCGMAKDEDVARVAATPVDFGQRPHAPPQ